MNIKNMILALALFSYGSTMNAMLKAAKVSPTMSSQDSSENSPLVQVVEESNDTGAALVPVDNSESDSSDTKKQGESVQVIVTSPSDSTDLSVQSDEEPVGIGAALLDGIAKTAEATYGAISSVTTQVKKAQRSCYSLEHADSLCLISAGNTVEGLRTKSLYGRMMTGELLEGDLGMIEARGVRFGLSFKHYNEVLKGATDKVCNLEDKELVVNQDTIFPIMESLKCLKQLQERNTPILPAYVDYPAQKKLRADGREQLNRFRDKFPQTMANVYIHLQEQHAEDIFEITAENVNEVLKEQPFMYDSDSEDLQLPQLTAAADPQ